jgi:hypothetical protein
MSNIYVILKDVFEKSPYREVLRDQLEKYIRQQMLDAPRIMGFLPENQFETYAFPFDDYMNKKIALYGAGHVGRSYYHTMSKEGKRPVIWVDSNATAAVSEYGIDLQPADRLVETTFDYIIVAVKFKGIADEIKSKLLSMGIAEDKILWKVPRKFV